MIAHEPLNLDNADFGAAATAVAETGKPIFYRGENDPTELALWHPPLYLYLLAGWFKIFGMGAAQARTFGALCAILQGWIVLAIVATLFGPAARSTIEPWFWAIYLLNPYTIQTASMLDIDSTIYGPILCWVLLATLSLNRRAGEARKEPPSRGEYAWLISAITLALWTKLTTILLVIPFIFLLLLRHWGAWRAARFTIVATALGVAAFGITYFGYGAAMHLDVKYTFGFLLFSFLTRGSSGHAGLAARFSDIRSHVEAMIPFMIRWTGLLPWLALAGAIMVAAWSTIRTKSERAWDYFLLMLLAGATTLYYCCQTTSWGDAPFKYVFVFWGLTLVAPLLLAFRSELWGPSSDPPTKLNLWHTASAQKLVVTLIFVTAVLYGRYWLQDHPMREWRLASWAVVPPALLLLPSIVGAFRYRKASAYSHAALLLGICIWMGTQFGVALYQLGVPYSTTYNYGQTGMQETAAFLRSNLSGNELFSAMKDLGHLTERRYYDDFAAMNAGPAESNALIQAVAAHKIKFAVFTESHGQDVLAANPMLNQWMQQHCKVLKSFGSYRIYGVKDP